MKKMCFLLNNNNETMAAISRVVNRIPCFIDAKGAGPYFEFYVTCRQEDAAAVKRILAPYV